MRLILISLAMCLAATSAGAADRVFYAGGGQHTVFHDVLALSDGTLLVAGGSDSLAWVPRGTASIALPADPITSRPENGRVAFVLHLSSDLEKILHVLHFPAGAAEDIRKLRVTSQPGQPTGDLLLSGTTREDRAAGGGYFIAKLDANFVNAVPKRLLWLTNVWAGGSHRDYHPWDVGGDGKVVYVDGKDFAPDWVSLRRLTTDGKPDIVPNWRYHTGRGSDGPVDGYWTPAGARKDVKVEHSAVVFKISRPDLRSWTDEDYKATEDDGNGKPRQGRWPNDLFFSGPATPDGDGGAKPPGYTGYRPGRNPTHRVVAVVVDRRDNAMYVGYSIQSRLPDGQPDFEPAVIAWDADGTLRWWNRLYHETTENSTPDQYVDHMAMDYANSRLIVGARCHGNNVMNFWNGKGTMKNSLNGKTGNVHISWIGALEARTGKFHNATWLAEFADGGKSMGKPLADGPLAGWPDPNGGWADLNTTRMQDLTTDAAGRVYVLAVGRRPVTTRNAYQQMAKPSEGSSAWSGFVRLYGPVFGEVAYSSILNPPWDLQTGTASPAPDLLGVAPVAGGLVVVGQHKAKDPSTIKPVPTANPAPWGNTIPADAGVIARLEVETAR
jgi:hypothetical protein